MIHPEKALTKAGLKPGNALYLTKPLGTGVITTALKQDAAEQDDIDAAVASMLTLNRAASSAAQEAGVSACTDVTGFGLLGHGTEMALKSGVGLRIKAADVPLLAGAERYAREDRIPGGGRRNREYYETIDGCGVTDTAGLEEWHSALLFGPETSGGLLVGIEPERAERLEAAFRDRGLDLWRIGDAVEGRGIEVV